MRTFAILLLCLVLSDAALAGEQPKGWLGAELNDVTGKDATELGWETPRGAKVVKAVDGSPAALAGLQPGDFVVSLDGADVENMAGFVAAIGGKAAGAAVKLRLLRGGKEKTISVTLAARSTEPKSAADGPLPMLDIGGHMALIRSLAFTPDGREIVSASDDKTIRVWDLATAKTVRTIRGEIAPGSQGKIYAMALSPDGKWLTAAGSLASGHGLKNGEVGAIRVYDFASGKVVALLKGHADVVDAVAFSGDGRYLISGSKDKTAIIWDAGSWSGASAGPLIRATVNVFKPMHRLQGHRDHIYAVGFTPDGKRAMTASDDHDLRLWSIESGAPLQTMSGHDNKVRSFAVAPDGTIASGDQAGEIRLWDGGTGAFIKIVARETRWVRGLRFSLDGKLLLSGAGEGTGGHYSHVYDVTSGREIVTYRGHDNVVVATAISPDGRWAATGGGSNEEIHIWDLRTGVRRQRADGQPLTLGGTGHQIWAAGFSADGSQIAWGTAVNSAWSSNNYGPLQTGLTLRAPNRIVAGPEPLVPEAARSFRQAEVKHGAWSLSHRKGGYYAYDEAILDISEGGKVRVSIERGSTDGLRHLAYSFTPDGETVISGGGNGTLIAYDREGHTLGEFIGHEGDVWAVATSPDGRYLLSGSEDQTVRLWNLNTRELLMTLFQGKDGEWVMWSPQGFYAASGPGAELMGWQINRGPEHEADYVTAAQLRTHLNRPDIVGRAIQLASTEGAVKEAHGADFKLADLLAKPVPRLSILTPAADATLRGGHAQVTVELEPTRDPVKLIRIQVNGRQISEEQPLDGDGFTPGTLHFEVPLAKGPNKIAIAAVNDTGETVATLGVNHEGEGDLDKRGTLYILAIGVDEYKGFGNTCGEDGKKTCDLRFAGADAKAFADAMEKRGGPLHSEVVKRVLVNGAEPAVAPTAANIRNALGLLRRTVKNDTVMLFVSGHGINEGPNYRFVPTDAAWDEGGFLRPENVVPWFAFQEALTSAAGRRILFLDTCHSGNAFNQRLLSESYEANIVVYSSARADQEAIEDGTLGSGHGLFTYALVEGVAGAARNEAGEIRAERLRDFLKSEVGALAAKLRRSQEPQYFRARDAGNYVLARAQ